MIALLAGLMILTGGAASRSIPNEEVFVRVDRNVPLERLAVKVLPLGRLDSRVRGSSTYLVHLRPGVTREHARDKFEDVAGVRALAASEEPFDMWSVESLDRKITHLVQDGGDGREEGKHSEKLAGKDEVDYLRAYRHFISQRAFPNDRVNWSALSSARTHVAAMLPIHGIRRTSGSRPMSSNEWEFMGPNNLAPPYRQYYGPGAVTGRINAVAFDPSDSNTLYACGAQGGVWKSTDGGSTWTWLSANWPMLGVNCMVVDPKHGQTIYVGLGDYHGEIGGSYGIMKTTDGGNTWTEIAAQTMGPVGVDRILVDPTNDQILIAGTGDVASVQTSHAGSLYRSTNGGITWTPLSVGGSACTWPALAASTPVGSTVRFYAVAGGIGPSGTGNSRVFKSDDHGATWQSLASPVTTDGSFHWAYSIATSPSNPNNVYVLDSEHQPDKKALFTSSNKGGTWKNVSSNLPLGPYDQGTGGYYNWSQCWYDYGLECGARSTGGSRLDVLYLGEIDITESVDGGNSWISVGGPVYDSKNAVTHSDQHCLAVCPSNPNLLLIGNDGGVYSVTYNSGTNRNTVTSLNAGLCNTMFYKIAMHPTDPNSMIGGTQDNATPLVQGALSNWGCVVGGDGGGCAINQTNTHIQFASVDGFKIYRTTDSWLLGQQDISPADLSQSYANLLASQNLPFVTQIKLVPSNQNLLYTATNYLWRWDDTAQSWTANLGNKDLTNGQRGAIVSSISIAPADSNRIYTGSSDGALYMSADEGATWTLLNSGAGSLPLAAITSIVVNPADENDILVGLSGTGLGAGHIWRCTDTQAAVASFANVSGSGTGALPDVPLNAIALDVYHPATTWWVATDLGVFESETSGASWVDASSPLGLPNVIVDDLIAVPGTAYLNAATYGSGVWRFSNSGTSLADFTVSPNVVLSGQLSIGTITLTAPAPAGGIVVSISSTAPSVARTPASVVVPEGATSTTFPIAVTYLANSPYLSIISVSYIDKTLTQSVRAELLVVTRASITPGTVLGGIPSTGTVFVNVPAPAGGAVVNVSSSNQCAVSNPTITIPEGATSASFPITTFPVSVRTQSLFSLGIGVPTASQSIFVTPPVPTSLTITPDSIPSGTTSMGTVILDGPTPSGGVIVNLSSSSISAVVPFSVTVPFGVTSASFSITTLAVTSSTPATITATVSGTSASAGITITPGPLAGLVLSPNPVAGGAPSTGTVSLGNPAPSGGAVVSLSSSNPLAVTPATLTIPGGVTSGNFSISTSSSSSLSTSTITATYDNASITATLLIVPLGISSLSLAPSTVPGGVSAIGTITLDAPAPASGTAVALNSSSSYAKTPTSITIANGATTATFMVSTTSVKSNVSATIRATFGSQSASATLVITPVGVLGLSVSTPVTGGQTSVGVVTLDGMAPTGGVKVSISSSSPKAKPPLSVTVPSGAATCAFKIPTAPVSSVTESVIKASGGGKAATATLVINQPHLASFKFVPSHEVGGASSIGTVTLSSVAPAGGIVVALQSNTSALTVPKSVTVASGSTRVSFTAKTVAVATQAVAQVAATLDGSQLSADLTLDPPHLVSLVLSPSSIAGGRSSMGTVTLSSVAPSGGIVATVMNAGGGVSTPATVVVPGGKTTAKFVVSTSRVTVDTSVDISVIFGAVTKSAVLTIKKQ
ncbi:MAG: hypothetical protein P4L46_15400 [Fimbriimonas sp.]|nr:hypothetical protein [Fimbriimonas sp.]